MCHSRSLGILKLDYYWLLGPGPAGVKKLSHMGGNSNNAPTLGFCLSVRVEALKAWSASILYMSYRYSLRGDSATVPRSVYGNL